MSKNHPPYDKMIECALEKLSEDKCASRQDIHKFIIKTYDLGLSVKVSSQLDEALKQEVRSGKLKKLNGRGPSASYKLIGSTFNEPTEINEGASTNTNNSNKKNNTSQQVHKERKKIKKPSKETIKKIKDMKKIKGSDREDVAKPIRNRSVNF